VDAQAIWPFVSSKTGQFTYFAEQLGEWQWKGKTVLDFGGNIGNIMRDPNSTIDEDCYWCLDIVQDSIDRGRATYPNSHWCFYDRHCFYFNPTGVRELPVPSLGLKFDYIVAFSVFTNTSRSDMRQLVSQLEAMLARNGTLVFTFIDPHYHSWPAKYEGDNLRWRLDLEIERGNLSTGMADRLAQQTKDADWFMLVNANELYLENESLRDYQAEEQHTCHVFYSTAQMRRLFPRAEILPPVNDEMQHCCVIRHS